MHPPIPAPSDLVDAPVAVTAHYELPAGGHFDRATYVADHLPLARRVLAPHGLLALWALHPERPPPTAPGGVADPMTSAITVAITVAVFTDRAQARAALAACGAELAAHARRYASHAPRVRLCALSGWPTAPRP